MKLAPSTSTADMIEAHLHRRDVTTHKRSVCVPQLAQYFSGLQYYSNRSLQYLPTPEYLPLNILGHLHISYNNCTLSNLADVLYNCKLLGIPESNPAIRTLVDAIPRIASPQKTTSASLSSIYGIVIVSAQYQISNSVIKQYICPLILQNCRSKQHVFSSNTKLMVILRILLIREARTGTRFMSDAEYIEILTRMVDQEEKAEKPPSVVYLSYLLTVAFDLALKKRVLAMLQKFRNYDERLTREDVVMILGNLFRFYWDSTHDAIHSILAVLDNVLVTLPKDPNQSNNKTSSTVRTLLYFLRMQFYHGKWVQTTVSQLALQGGDMNVKMATIILSETTWAGKTKNAFPLQAVHAAQRMIITSDIELWSASDLLYVLHSCPLPLIRSLAPNRVFDILKEIKKKHLNERGDSHQFLEGM
eukprot:PhF_6_TR7932/c1_g1_i8/m.11918